jgi:hypothetical protein
LGLGVDEFYSMTWGNFQRYALGYVKRSWVVNREIVAAIETTGGRKRVTGDEIFSFGVTEKQDTQPTPEDRERMRRRRENTVKLMRNGR